MLAKRLRKMRRSAGLTQIELAVAMGDRYDNTMISHVETGRSGLVGDGLARAARALGVSTDYLLGLTDDSRPYSKIEQDIAELDAYRRERREPPIDYDLASDTLDEEDLERLPEVVAAAGIGAEVYDETVADRVPFRRSWLRQHGISSAHCQIIGVHGESMEPTLPDGCSIIVDRNRRQLRDESIYVMRTEEGLVVKRVKQNAHGWWLLSDNPTWAPLFLTEETDIIGEVRWAARTFW